MKKIAFILLPFALLSLGGCAHQQAPSTPPAASHVAVDQAVTEAKASQQKAAQQVTVIEKKITDPALKQEVVDLHSTITDLGLKLNDATAKIQWYEGQYQTLYRDNSDTHAALKTAVDYGISEHKAHVAADKRADVVIYAFALAIALAAGRAAWKVCVTPVSGWAGLVVPGMVFLLAFGAAYGFAYFVLTWLGQFLPDFSNLIPSIKGLFHKL